MDLTSKPRIFRLLAMMSLVMTFTGCAAVSKFKIGKDGMYRVKESSYVVWAPSQCLLDVAVRDEKPNYVQFTTGAGYWMASGQYDLRVISPIPKQIVDAKSFMSETREFFSGYMLQDNNPKTGFDFKITEQTEMQIGGKPAFRATAISEGKAMFTATAVYQADAITIAGLIYPLKGENDFAGSFPSGCYEQFVSSVRETN
jgi:hypothetical protein